MGVEILDHGTRVLTAPGATFGTDALLLGRFAPAPPGGARWICAAAAASSRCCGTMPATAAPARHLRLDAAASALCAQAAADNEADHITPLCSDLRQFCTAGPEQGQYDFAACNPPYFCGRAAQPDPRRAEARHTDSCTTADAVDCAAAPLRDGGRFCCASAPSSWPRS